MSAAPGVGSWIRSSFSGPRPGREVMVRALLGEPSGKEGAQQPGTQGSKRPALWATGGQGCCQIGLGMIWFCRQWLAAEPGRARGWELSPCHPAKPVPWTKGDGWNKKEPWQAGQTLTRSVWGRGQGRESEGASWSPSVTLGPHFHSGACFLDSVSGPDR